MSCCFNETYRNVLLSLTAPKPLCDEEWIKLKIKPYKIKELCYALESEDNDFPLLDFNFKSNMWIIRNKNLILKDGDKCKILWKNCQLNGGWIQRVFRQAGWDVQIRHWEALEYSKTIEGVANVQNRPN